jgi:uncharacterized protein YdcH (DUF465 family)
MSDRIERARCRFGNPLPAHTDASIEDTSMEEPMNILIERLIATHRRLNREIRRERSRLAPDDLRLKQLKKLRLATKDQLVRHIPDGAELRLAARRLLSSFRRGRLYSGEA